MTRYHYSDDRSTYPAIRVGQKWNAKLGGVYRVDRVGGRNATAEPVVTVMYLHNVVPLPSSGNRRNRRVTLDDWRFLNRVTTVAYEPPIHHPQVQRAFTFAPERAERQHQSDDDRSTYPEIRAGQVWSGKIGGVYEVECVSYADSNGARYVTVWHAGKRFAINDWVFLNRAVEMTSAPPIQEAFIFT